LRAVKRGRSTIVLDVDYEAWLASFPPVIPDMMPGVDRKSAKPDVSARATKMRAARQREALVKARRRRVRVAILGAPRS
jgi:hypothetical protein